MYDLTDLMVGSSFCSRIESGGRGEFGGSKEIENGKQKAARGEDGFGRHACEWLSVTCYHFLFFFLPVLGLVFFSRFFPRSRKCAIDPWDSPDFGFRRFFFHNFLDCWSRERHDRACSI